MKNPPPDLSSHAGGTIAENDLSWLRQFVRKPRTAVAAEEKCELCAKKIGAVHNHLFELANGQVLCACEPCAILFSNQAAPRYRRIPRDIRRLATSVIDDHEWDSLLIPINLAYFFYSSAEGRVVAQYPSPGGALRSELDLEYWAAIVERSSVLKTLQPDVEALVVNRVSTPPKYYIAPIDQCYRLTGILRTHWRGIRGGDQVWKEIDQFFAELREASVEVSNA